MKDKSNAGGMNSVFVRWIQFGSATVELVFAPEERDVYSHERRLKDLAPLGAKPGQRNLAQPKAVALLRSED